MYYIIYVIGLSTVAIVGIILGVFVIVIVIVIVISLCVFFYCKKNKCNNKSNKGKMVVKFLCTKIIKIGTNVPLNCLTEKLLFLFHLL